MWHVNDENPPTTVHSRIQIVRSPTTASSPPPRWPPHRRCWRGSPNGPTGVRASAKPCSAPCGRPSPSCRTDVPSSRAAAWTPQRCARLCCCPRRPGRGPGDDAGPDGFRVLLPVPARPRPAATDPARYRVVNRRTVDEHEAAELIRSWIQDASTGLGCGREPWQSPEAGACAAATARNWRRHEHSAPPPSPRGPAVREGLGPSDPRRHPGALILDFDGTLADTTSSHEQALRAALQPHGHDLDHAWYRRHVGLSIHDLPAALPLPATRSSDPAAPTCWPACTTSPPSRAA
ncbi:hypothetical protein SAMN05421811_11263 [Nonomuraea wenchangensis]|uniref:Haloacid dehalogenase-like hydrolase n=1 Tax=Nonomuraea wenchangensis TaxID=568860 RepID=A0A1I0L589_9ACTN|nr:hypothetical protein SAMN05421811_11263 [Nonomuraea wenchangensis]